MKLCMRYIDSRRIIPDPKKKFDLTSFWLILKKSREKDNNITHRLQGFVILFQTAMHKGRITGIEP